MLYFTVSFEVHRKERLKCKFPAFSENHDRPTNQRDEPADQPTDGHMGSYGNYTSNKYSEGTGKELDKELGQNHCSAPTLTLSILCY